MNWIFFAFVYRTAGHRRPPKPVLHARVARRARVRRVRDERYGATRRIGDNSNTFHDVNNPKKLDRFFTHLSPIL